LQSFNKFGNLRPRKNRLCHKENLKGKIENFSFFEVLKFFVFEFWKKIGHTTRGNEKIEQKIQFWNLKKNWPYHRREMKNNRNMAQKFEKFHFSKLKWKFPFEIWKEKWPYHRRKWNKFEIKKSYISLMPPR
jgi:hypothetical protein